MQITWLGTAGFEFQFKDQIFFLDPFFTRNAKANPFQPLKPDQVEKADAVFISHGHFDHLMDVPELLAATKGIVHCSETAAGTLMQNGVEPGRIKKVTKDRLMFSFKHFNACAFFSNHVKFDTKLVIFTLLKINVRAFKYHPLLSNYPCGQVLSWRFYIGDKIVHFFGSAGVTGAELARIRDEKIDILLLPLQGHSEICRIGARIVEGLNPKTVILHHHDNFFPPISKTENIQPFLDDMQTRFPEVKIIVPKINTPLHFND